jgi:hypothetical protein
MSTQPQISVLGVHRLPVDDVTVRSHPDEFRIIPGPDRERLRADLRSMLQSTVLVEFAVTGRDERFDASLFRQPQLGPHVWDRIVSDPVVWYLTADGEGRLETGGRIGWGQQPLLAPNVASFRVAL